MSPFLTESKYTWGGGEPCDDYLFIKVIKIVYIQLVRVLKFEPDTPEN